MVQAASTSAISRTSSLAGSAPALPGPPPLGARHSLVPVLPPAHAHAPSTAARAPARGRESTRHRPSPAPANRPPSLSRLQLSVAAAWNHVDVVTEYLTRLDADMARIREELAAIPGSGLHDPAATTPSPPPSSDPASRSSSPPPPSPPRPAKKPRRR